MPKFAVDIVETVRYRLIVEAPDAETIEQEDPDTFADELSNNEGFVGVENRVIEAVHEETDDEDAHFILIEKQGDTPEPSADPVHPKAVHVRRIEFVTYALAEDVENVVADLKHWWGGAEDAMYRCRVAVEDNDLTANEIEEALEVLDPGHTLDDEEEDDSGQASD